MHNLIQSVKLVLAEGKPLPFSAYSSLKTQQLFNVPVVKPTLICVLSGNKLVGKSEVDCASGDFVFLSNSNKVNMRNIAKGSEYYALLIEFEFSDFACLPNISSSSRTFFKGQLTESLLVGLQQFVQWSPMAPVELWSHRRQEILQHMFYGGYTQVADIAESPSLSHKLYELMSRDVTAEFNTEILCQKFALSESSLRRKLKAEGTNSQEIKDRVRLGHGLHLLQSTHLPIGTVAELCAYQSQSRFTAKFKQLFGLTPTELKKTRMPD